MPSTTVLRPRERLEYGAARLLGALPPQLQVRLSGKPPVSLDGDTLAPDVQLYVSKRSDYSVSAHGSEVRSRPH